MNGFTKKVLIYSLACTMQLGIGATLVEAATFHSEAPQRIVQLNRGNRHERQREHDERRRQEDIRHEREMRRRDREDYREWQERREREYYRHNQALSDLEAFLLGVAIGSILK